MKTKKSLTWIIFCLILISSCGSTKHTQKPVPIPEQTQKTKTSSNMTETDKYISSYKFLAIKEMQRAKIPASITMAQAILESSVGQSYIARNANNHFGVKCNSKWTGKTINYDDDTANECFKSYTSVEESYIDHSDHLTGNPRYSTLFNLDISDYKGWATGLKAAGYATRSNYAELLIGIIERYQLNDLDKFSTNKPATTSGNTNQKSAQFVYNGLPAVMVRDGDTYDRITSDNDITMEKLVKFNDLEPNQPLHQDMILYLKSKKSKGKESYHIVKEGESMYAISQDYGIKLDNLLDMNLMVRSENPATGEIIYLKSKRADPPALAKDMPPAEQPKDTSQQSIFSDNQNKTIAQNNDFVMPKKDTVQSTSENTSKTQESPKTIDVPAPSDPGLPVKPVLALIPKPSVQPVSSNSTTINVPSTAITNPAPSNNKSDLTKPAVTKSGDFHVVQKGETMYSISKLYGLKVADIQGMNNLPTTDVKIGQSLLVNKSVASNPALKELTENPSTVMPLIPKNKKATTPATNSKPLVTTSSNQVNTVTSPNVKTPVDTSKKRIDTVYHVVEQGETFYSISRTFKVKISDIIAWNSIKEYKLDIGQKIVVGAPETTIPTVSQTQNNALLNPAAKNNLVEGKYHVVQPKETLFSLSKKYNITIDQLKKWNSIQNNSISIGQKIKVIP